MKLLLNAISISVLLTSAPFLPVQSVVVTNHYDPTGADHLDTKELENHKNRVGFGRTNPKMIMANDAQVEKDSDHVEENVVFGKQLKQAWLKEEGRKATGVSSFVYGGTKKKTEGGGKKKDGKGKEAFFPLQQEDEFEDAKDEDIIYTEYRKEDENLSNGRLPVSVSFLLRNSPFYLASHLLR